MSVMEMIDRQINLMERDYGKRPTAIYLGTSQRREYDLATLSNPLYQLSSESRDKVAKGERPTHAGIAIFFVDATDHLAVA